MVLSTNTNMSIEFLDTITIVGDVSASGNVYAQNLSAAQDVTAAGYLYGWGDYIQYHTTPWPQASQGALKYYTTIGNGVDTNYTITHNLSTEEVNVSIYETSSKALVYTYVEILNSQSIKVSFHSPAITNGYKVVVIG